MDCIFCKIIKGEIPCNKIYEDENVLAFLDISPVNKGHTLVIPKKHCTNVFDADEETLCNISKAVKKIAKAMRLALGIEGVNIQTNNGQTSGQVVMHLHTHIIPRYKGDGLKLWPQGKYKDKEAEEIKEKIVSFIKE